MKYLTRKEQNGVEQIYWATYYKLQDMKAELIEAQEYKIAAKAEFKLIRLETLLEEFYCEPWNYKSNDLIQEAKRYLK